MLKQTVVTQCNFFFERESLTAQTVPFAFSVVNFLVFSLYMSPLVSFYLRVEVNRLGIKAFWLPAVVDVFSNKNWNAGN